MGYTGSICIVWSSGTDSPKEFAGQAERFPYNRLALDDAAGIRFAPLAGLDAMKNFLRLSTALFVFSFAGFVHASNWISQVVQVGATFNIDVPGGHVLIIRNFTQDFSNPFITGR